MMLNSNVSNSLFIETILSNSSNANNKKNDKRVRGMLDIERIMEAFRVL